MEDLYHFNKEKKQQNKKTKRKKEQYIENLKEGDVVNDIFAIKMKRSPRTYKNGTWFSLLATDKTGEIDVKFWGGKNKERVKKLYDSFQVGDVIKITLGNVETYKEKPQISINEKKGKITRCNSKEYEVRDFLPSIDKEKIEQLLQYIKKEIKNIEDKQLKKLLNMFFDNPDFVEQYISSPSAITHHHNYLGGNLEHTVSVLKLCKKICETYDIENKDLVISSGILHDIGKIKEYKTTAAIDKTELGNFIGHIVMGDRWIKEKINKIREKGEEFSPELETHLSHIMLSHHGKYEFGSPRMPKTIEACIVHHADNMDAQVKNFIQKIEEGRKQTEEDWSFLWDSEAGKKRLMYLGEEY